MLRKIPHTYVIVFALVVFSAMLTWVIPGGAFERQMVSINGIERNVVIPGSFHYTENSPQTWQIFSAIFDGFVDKADIIVFILIIGGAFWIMNESKAIEIAIASVLRLARKAESNRLVARLGADNLIFIPVMLVFSLFGAIFGMSEETIAFTIIFVPLAISMGYDSITGVAVCFVAAALGFAGAVLNPFTIGIAQGLSDLPLFSGLEYRMFCWLVINIFGFCFIIRYTRKIKKDPAKSTMFAGDDYWRESRSVQGNELKYYTPVSGWIVYIMITAVLAVSALLYPVSRISLGGSGISLAAFPVIFAAFMISGWLSLRRSVHFFIITILIFTIFILITGVMGHGWYIREIATLFFVMGLATGIAMNYSPNRITRLFLDGVRDIQSAAIIVGLAGGIIIILQNGRVIDTLLYKMSGMISGTGKFTSVSMMYVIQNFINLFMPSGSAKAALTMPVMSQFSDLIGVSRQATVMAFQLGDGFTNIITPTSGVLLGVLSVARIPYDKWFKWVLPLVIGLIIIGFLLLIPTVYMDLKGF